MRLIFTRFIVVAVLLQNFWGCSSENPTAPTATDLNDIPALMDFYNVPGVSIAVIKDFQIDYFQVYGVKDVQTQEPVAGETLFQAASISKSVSAMAAVKFVQDGKILFDENINSKLTTWKVPEKQFTANEKVTLRRLISHTAGTTVHGFRGYRYTEPVPSLVEVLNGASPANSPVIFVDRMPGREFKYSGGGFCFMQQVLIDVEQKPFPQILQELVLGPLGMQNSSFAQPLPAQEVSYASSGHYTNGNVVPSKHHIYPEMAAAGLWTTPNDLALFLIELQRSMRGELNKVLTTEMVQKMMSPVVVGCYSLGLEIYQVSVENYFGHSGANEGFRCLMIAHNSGVGLVVMTNSDNGSKLNDKIFDLIATKENWPGAL